MAAPTPRASTRGASSAVVRDQDDRLLLATATYCTSGEELLSALRDLLVKERRHDTFRPTNVPSGRPDDGLERGDLGPIREAVRSGAELAVELEDHPGWSPAADAARAQDGALAVWTGRTGWTNDSIAPAPIRIAKRHTTCEGCGAQPNRIALRERLCQECGADLPRPSR